MSILKVGYIPEHFSTPIFFAQTKGFFKAHGVDVELIAYPSGSGHLIQSLEDGSLDIAIGLTEAFVRGIAQGKESYKLIGTYVESKLRWAVITGFDRDELTSQEQLQGKRISVSRIGSGSYVMSFVLALQQGFKKPFFESFPVLSTFANLRDSVNLKENVEPSDAFMWEYFTTKKYYDSKEVKQIGEIYTPWPSWVINARTELVDNKEGTQLSKFLKALQEGIEYFNAHHEEAVKYINDNLDYSIEDAQEWLKTVIFKKGQLNQVDHREAIENTYKVLIDSGVLNQSEEKLIIQRLESGVVTGI